MYCLCCLFQQSSVNQKDESLSWQWVYPTPDASLSTCVASRTQCPPSRQRFRISSFCRKCLFYLSLWNTLPIEKKLKSCKVFVISWLLGLEAVFVRGDALILWIFHIESNQLNIAIDMKIEATLAERPWRPSIRVVFLIPCNFWIYEYPQNLLWILLTAFSARRINSPLSQFCSRPLTVNFQLKVANSMVHM